MGFNSEFKGLIGVWWSKNITRNQKKKIYNSMVKSVLVYGAETWSLCQNERMRINATEMDALRRSARISKLDIKKNEYIRGKMDARGMILDDITRKQLIWYGHVERMDQTRLLEIMIHWKPEGRKKRGRPRRTWKDGIYTAMSERDLRMGEWNSRRQWNMKYVKVKVKVKQSHYRPGQAQRVPGG